MTEVKAKLNYFRGSPIKIRRVAELIKGRPVVEARHQLAIQPGRPAPVLRKVLDSATANAAHNFELSEENLFIKEVRVDQGPALKRMFPRARGRADMLRKPTAHITITLDLIESDGSSKSQAPISKQDTKSKSQNLKT